MYHPAKVQEIISNNGKTAFLVETWDENVFTIGADEELDADNISQGDIVLLDYSPDERYDLPTPKQVVSMVLGEEQGERIWDRYRELFEDNQGQQTAGMMQQVPNSPFDGGYIG